MMFLWLLLGLALPTLSGWLLLSILEGKSPVLQPVERVALGFLLGTTLLMFLSFLGNVSLGIPLTLLGFLGVQTAGTVALTLFFIAQRKMMGVSAPVAALSSSPAFSHSIKICIAILAFWAGIKLMAGLVLLTGTPVYFDDVFNNWNKRGKMYYVMEQFTLGTDTEDAASPEPETVTEAVTAGGVHSYPPTVPLLKTWLAKLAGNWREGLVNTPHIAWYLCVLILLFYALRRRTSLLWSLLGTFGLMSIPLYLVHGTNPYADVFLSAHIFAAVSLLFAGVAAHASPERNTFLRLGAVAAGMLVFTKNEALVLHLPPLLLLLCLSMGMLVWKKNMSKRDALVTLAWYAGCIGLVLIPWVSFKLLHGLPFGNAKGLPGFVAFWQPGVLHAIMYGLFFEGNWLLFFPLLMLAIILSAKHLRTLPPALLPLAFFLIIFLSQLPIYLFTGLATEALKQTGYARGIIQILPVGMLTLTLLLENLLQKKK